MGIMRNMMHGNDILIIGHHVSAVLFPELSVLHQCESCRNLILDHHQLLDQERKSTYSGDVNKESMKLVGVICQIQTAL